MYFYYFYDDLKIDDCVLLLPKISLFFRQIFIKWKVEEKSVQTLNGACNYGNCKVINLT